MNKFFRNKTYNEFKNDYFIKLNVLSSWIWKNDLNNNDFENWLNNFDGIVDHDDKHEKLNSLHLLKQYMFFGMREVRQMLKVLYENKFYKPNIHKLIKENSEKLEDDYEEILSRTKFFGIGNPSESSSFILYMFRQENELHEKCFWSVHDIFAYENSKISGTRINEKGQKIKNYIFIDDISGTGTQAQNFFSGGSQNINLIQQIKKYNPDADIYYFTLFNTKKARLVLNDVEHLKVKSIFELDDTYEVYNNKSRYFARNDESCFERENCCNEKCERYKEVKYAEQICLNYFKRLEFDNEWYKFGFKGSQLLLSFFYNTPNNTIPLFWKKSSQWYSIFKRYEKFIKE